MRTRVLVETPYRGDVERNTKKGRPVEYRRLGAPWSNGEDATR